MRLRSIQSLAPRTHDFLKDLRQRSGDSPPGVVCFHLPQITVIANVVTAAVLIDIGVELGFASTGLHHFKCLEDGAGVLLSTTKIVDLAAPRGLNKFIHECGNIC